MTTTKVMRGGWFVGPMLRLTALSACMVQCAAALAQDDAVLRVCADPNNLPQSNQRGEGYENRIAEELASDLGKRLEYTWFPQRMGFVRNTLRSRDPTTQQYKCDLIIGVPKGYELTATTRPYMRSTYALIFPQRKELDGVRTAQDFLKLPEAVRKGMRIGVFAGTPGADWLQRNGLLGQGQFYAAQSGDPAETPAVEIARDLEAGRIHLAVVWGPVAGYLSRQRTAEPVWRIAPFGAEEGVKYDFEIAMGVRFGEKEWKEELDRWIERNQDRLNEILASYQIPLLDERGQLAGQPEAYAAPSARDEIPLRLAGP